MLARNFKTPADLGISNAEFEALAKVLGMLERGDIPEREFNMARIRGKTSCGTVACICGWASIVSDGRAFPMREMPGERWYPISSFSALPKSLRDLFGVDNMKVCFEGTRQSAAIALRSYLTTGEPRWAEALAE